MINAMINYMLGVKREDKIWFEITDDQSDRTSAHSQTSIITVYGFYLQESPIHLTIIDTPGYGDTHGVDLDKQITVSLYSLSKSAEGIHEIDAVCLVIKATKKRLSDRQQYIFDAVQSLFGRDIAENTVLLFAHSTEYPPKNALTAVKEAEIKCAVNDKNQPVYFLFDNCQSDAADEEYEMIQEQSWNLSFRGMTQFFKFLDTIRPKSLKMTRDVLQEEQLEAQISNLKSRVELMQLKQNELKQTQEALEQNKEHVKKNENFEYEVKVFYKEKVDIDPAVASMAICCTVCEENCHYPGCCMDPVGVNSIETAALGRPFQLGMLYDCRRDALVPGIRLWSKEQLQQNISTKPQINTVFTVTASDSTEDKSRLLDIDGCLKLSFLGGLVHVSGAANFLKDTKKSFNQQRLTLHYHSTTKFDELIMNHFPSGEMAHYDSDVATHVVTAVLYGADACFVFDREVSSDEDKRVIAGEVKAVFGKLKGISAGANINLNDNQKTAAQKFSCTFYGDFQLPCNPTSFEDAVKVLKIFPNCWEKTKNTQFL
ncbi:PHLOEM PROTEIN 2-LIKE A3 [Labeo rohita]|uniref:PHLOEM PROTEIN 2-LIKE A3 n=1 Tax=Labeo rohita TaxID=84645 RepID=A0A498LZA8_LABRO|nr:PHLOEM PROTEIN 2-LIKE A3 [Labeo rohita]